jgi:chromatin structure-remodeling complex subunit RSC1/2
LFHRSVNKRIVPDYYDIIKEPMALSIIKQRINKREYKQVADFVRDFALVGDSFASHWPPYG